MPTRRARSTSGQRTTCEDRVPVPTDWLLRTIAANGTRTVSDAAVQPKPFTGKADQDPEGWFEFFERYADFRQLEPAVKKRFFCILLQEGAGDWLSTLPNAAQMSYGELTNAFKANYYRSPELKWKEAGALWNQAQGPSERVEDFVTRLRKAARRLNFPAEVLHYAVINGLRGPIRLHVLQQGVKSIDDTVRAAKVAEAAATTAPDAISVLVLDAMQASAKASEKQAAEMKQLAASVATLTAGQAAPVERVNTPHRHQCNNRSRGAPCCRHRRISSARRTHSVRRIEQGEATGRLTVMNRRRRDADDADGLIGRVTAEPTGKSADTAVRQGILPESAVAPSRTEIDGLAGRPRSIGATRSPGLE
jgi:hypothetical protein